MEIRSLINSDIVTWTGNTLAKITTILLLLCSYYFPAYAGDNIAGDKVMGDKIINQNMAVPKFSIEVSKRAIMSGESIDFALRADQPKHLSGAVCQWKTQADDLLDVQLQTSSCQASATATFTAFPKHLLRGQAPNTVKIVATVTKNNKVFEARSEFFVTVDMTSDAVLKSRSKEMEEMVQKQLSSTFGSISGIQGQALSFGQSIAKQSLLSDLQRDLSDVVQCQSGGCFLHLKDFCRAGAKTLRWQHGEHKRSTSLSSLCIEFNTNDRQHDDRVCLASSVELPTLVPGKRLESDVMFEGGESASFSLTVPGLESNYGYGGGQWTRLKPLGANQQQPYAALQFNEQSNEFHFLLAAGCDRDSVIYRYDVDGKGAIETRSGLNLNTPFKIRQPKVKQLSVAYTNANGEEKGPFYYQFDMDRFLIDSIAQSKSMKLVCELDRRNRAANLTVCQIPRRGKGLLLWSAVSKIHYGNDAGQLNQVYPMQVSLQDLRAVQRKQAVNLSYGFNVPQDWEDVFYQLTLKDGSTRPVVRVPLF